MTCKIIEHRTPRPGWSYHSGTTIYVERLLEGRLIAASLQATGIPFYDRDEDVDTPAFDLQIDGESLYFGWKLDQSRIDADDATGCQEAFISLKHTWKPVKIDIRTTAAGDGFFRRRMTLSNLSEDKTLALNAVTPLSGLVFRMVDGIDNHRTAQTESGASPYRVGWMRDTEWGQEGNFQWLDLALHTETAFGSYQGRSGHTTPFAVAHNNIYGGYFAAGLAWSGSWRMTFRCDQGLHIGFPGAGSLRYSLMPVMPAPMRLLVPGESIELPETHFGMNHESFDKLIQSWHSHLRRHVLPQAGDGLQPVIYNHWGFTEHELSEQSLEREIKIASEIGAELFMVDAGWYADEGTAWGDTVGDWEVGNRLPDGLEPVFALARSRGMRCGLWVEIESAGKNSKVVKEHPDWLLTRYGNPVVRYLDFSKPEVQKYAENHIIRLIERYKLDMLRLDYNMTPMEGGFNERNGRYENTSWRHFEALHGIFDRVRVRFPKLQLENCSSGGGRSDLGMNSRFTTTWISDWMKMPRTLRILNGMSIALPPEHVNRLFGVCLNASYQGNPEMHLQAIMFCHPAISGLAPDFAEANPDIIAMTRKYVKLYKDFVRQWHRHARFYHHTPVISGVEASGWCVFENVSIDQTMALAGVFRLINSREDSFHLRFRGLDPARRYRIVVEPGSSCFEADGISLMEQGFHITLDTPLTSRLLLCEAIPGSD